MFTPSLLETRLYSVTLSLIGWAHTQNDPWICHECTHATGPRMIKCTTCLQPQIAIFIVYGSLMYNYQCTVSNECSAPVMLSFQQMFLKFMYIIRVILHLRSVKTSRCNYHSTFFMQKLYQACNRHIKRFAWLALCDHRWMNPHRQRVIRNEFI